MGGGLTAPPIYGFQSTLLIRGATPGAYRARCASLNFNPRSSYEERHWQAHPCRIFNDDFNPRSSYEERHVNVRYLILFHFISIHAPHTRSD